MKRVMIFGAGQAGQMTADWLPADQQLISYIDNSEQLQGSSIKGIEIRSADEALACGHPDIIWISVLNREASDAIRSQLHALGFSGRIMSVLEIRERIDIRLSALRLLAEQTRERSVCGSCAELGVYQGAFAAEINRLFPDRTMYLFDTFEGFDEQDLKTERMIGGRNAHAQPGVFSDTSVARVIDRLPHPEKVYVCKGRFPESMRSGAKSAAAEDVRTEKDLREEMFAAISLDTDLYEPTLSGLRFFYPRLVPGGFILIHDYNSAQYPGVHRAACEFADSAGVYFVPLMDLHGTAVLIKESENG